MKRLLIRSGAVVLMPLVLAGCNNLPTKLSHTPEFAPVYPVAEQKAGIPTGAIYNGRGSDMWFGKGRSYAVGDLITVLLNESTQANRKQKGDYSRKDSNDVLPAKWSDKAGVNLNGSTIKSEGEGSADQTASLTGSIAVTVVEVLANGNLMVRGEKQLALTEGTEVIQVSGIVRPEDVSPNNTLQSRRLANAQIAYRGTGDMASAAKPGWGTSLLYKIWPF
ncbi:MAG: flagellar basal body L-ring protein FlgH [Limnohabitans sp.]|jgi:flagellar L-ring protein precursor FlgH|nr:MAG: flagellar basal body L-ring protein FlgH [Limnohabitans sp.]